MNYGIKDNQLMQSFKTGLYSVHLFKNSTILGIVQNEPAITSERSCRYDVCLMTSNEQIVAAPSKV
ncbi:hypothetical protein HMPREF0497_1545 [Lentilactobacillus buchneri ATCC 11577]|nr:hypothetical protein HMPREF0497_1545 [Lentilactobacillus buchneri ATCC 11577]